MARTQIDEVAPVGDVPVVRVGSRFLPVPAALLPPLLDPVPGMIDLPVPPGTPAHATTAGRVTHAEGQSVGEVVVRNEDGTRFHYRRLLPSTVTVVEGQSVEAGAVLGLVAAARNGTALGFGIQASDDTWDDAADRLVGLADPAELYLLPPLAGDAGLVAKPPSQRRPVPASRPATEPSATRPAAPVVTPQPAAAIPDKPPMAVDTTPDDPPAGARSVTERLTRRRPRSTTADVTPAGTEDPAVEPGDQPATEPPAPARDEADPTAGAPPPDEDLAETPATDTVDRAPDEPPVEDPDDGSPDPSETAQAAARLVGRRRRPGGRR